MRLPDWEKRLHAYLASIRRDPHLYGKHDCLLHCASVIEAVTGADLADAHRGKYKSQATAVRHLKSLGFETPDQMLDSALEEKPVGFAGRGDIVLTPPDVSGWPVPGVCVGAVALCVGTEGLVREPRARWLKAWSVA